MKNRFSFIILCLFSSCMAFVQGILFHEGTMEEAFKKAEAENKLVFVDLYTSWCGPCKKVAKYIFPQQKIGQYYNSHFVNCKLNAENGEGKELAEKFKVKSYPTFLYLKQNGELVYTFSGAKDVKGFITEAEKVNAVAPYGGWGKMQEAYQSGTKDSELLWDYYELVGEHEKQDVLIKYLKSLTDECLFEIETGKLTEKLEKYDSELYTRLVGGRVKLGEKDKDYNFSFTFPLQWQISGWIDKAIENGDSERFQELLELKKKFSVLPKTQDEDIEWI